MSAGEDENGNRRIPALNGSVTRNFVISDSLRHANVTILQKTGLDVSIQIQRPNEEKPIAILFKIKKEEEGGFANGTIKEFQKAADRRNIDVMTQQAIIGVLSTNKDYLEGLQYRREDDPELREGIGIPVNTGSFFIDDTAAERESARDRDPLALEVGEQEYNDAPETKELPLLTIDEVLNLDKPQRVRLIAEVYLIMNRFDLIKQIVINCDNKNCKDRNKHERYNLKNGLYNMADFPYVFPGGPAAAEQFMKCRTCGKFMIATPTQNRYQPARMIELKHVDIKSKDNDVTTITPVSRSDVRNIDTLRTRVSGIYASNMNYGEVVEMIGELLIVPAGVESATRQTMQAVGGMRRRNNNEEIVFTENMGKYHKLFYVDKIKFVNRAKQLDFNSERDTKAIRIFSSISTCPKCGMTGFNMKRLTKDLDGNMVLQNYSDKVDRLVSTFAPHIVGEDLKKEALILQAVGPSSIVEGSYYDRKTVNALMIGDAGTAKTDLGHEAVKLLLGSREVVVTHSTTKSIIAVAEKDADGHWFARPGPAILAHRATTFIDEIAASERWDDQDQFLQLMQTNRCLFNKAGIDRELISETNFLSATNPKEINWLKPQNISKSDMPLKLTILDRQDMILIFKDAAAYKEGYNGMTQEQNISNFADDMIESMRKKYNLDYTFLKKYIFYAKTSERFKVAKFADKRLIEDLKDLWKEIKSKQSELLGTRGLKSIMRIASCYARLMLKPTIDKEVVDRTIWFVTETYKLFGTLDIKPENVEQRFTNDREKVFDRICGILKDIATGKQWFMSSDEESGILEVPFKDLIETLNRRDPEVANYLHITSSMSKIENNRRVRGLHAMFSERVGRDGMNYNGGRVKIVSDKAPRGLVLQWMPDLEGEEGKEGEEVEGGEQQ
jgi:DNA replicative helicase MCM subunit Mcm2 (Cdc46/Mcm family)